MSAINVSTTSSSGGSNLSMDLFETVDQFIVIQDKKSFLSNNSPPLQKNSHPTTTTSTNSNNGSNLSSNGLPENHISSSKSYSSSTLDVLNSLIDFESPSSFYKSKPSSLENLDQQQQQQQQQQPNSTTFEDLSILEHPKRDHSIEKIKKLDNQDIDKTNILDNNTDDIDSLIMDIDNLVVDLGDIENDLRNSRKDLRSLMLPRNVGSLLEEAVKSGDDSSLYSVQTLPNKRSIPFTKPSISSMIFTKDQQQDDQPQHQQQKEENEIKDELDFELEKDYTLKEIENLIKISTLNINQHLEQQNQLQKQKKKLEKQKLKEQLQKEKESTIITPPLPSMPNLESHRPLQESNSSDSLQSSTSPRLQGNNNNNSNYTPTTTTTSPNSNSCTAKWTYGAARKSLTQSGSGSPSPTLSPTSLSPPGSPVIQTTTRQHIWRKSQSTSHHPRSSTDPSSLNTFDRKSIINLEPINPNNNNINDMDKSTKHRSTFPGSLDEIKNQNDGSHIISPPVLTRSTITTKFRGHLAPLLTFDSNTMEYSIMDPKKQKIDLENQTKINRLKELLKNYRNKIISLINKISKVNEDLQRVKNGYILKFEKRNKFYLADHQFHLSTLYREYYSVKILSIDLNQQLGKERMEFLKSKLIHIGSLITVLKNYNQDKSQNIIVYSSFFLKTNELLNPNISILSKIRKLKLLSIKEKLLKSNYKVFMENNYYNSTIEKRARKLFDIISRGKLHKEFKHYYPWDENHEIQMELSTLLWDSRFKEGKQIHHLINIISDDCTGPKNIKAIDIEIFIEKFCEKLIETYNLNAPPPLPSGTVVINNTLKSSNALLSSSNTIVPPPSHISTQPLQSPHQITLENIEAISSLPTPPSTMPHAISVSGNNVITQVEISPQDLVSSTSSTTQIYHLLSQLFKRIFYPEIYHLMKIIISKETGGVTLKYDYDLVDKINQCHNLDLQDLNLMPTDFPSLSVDQLKHHFQGPISTLNELNFHVVPIDLVYTIQQTLSSIYNTCIGILNNKEQISNPPPPKSPIKKSSKSFHIKNDGSRLKTGSFIGKDQYLSFEQTSDEESIEKPHKPQQQQNHHHIERKPPVSLSADDLFPLLIYVLMNSDVIGFSKCIVTIIEQFSSELELNGEFGWCSVSFQAAISHLNQL
ncbi:hypothetical protein DLAC_11063 [Tieghemostelium lacteum]|uniref:VPS9 domain-containing protein n=1 Tax=Tieghemostelium lacteum TaxID=361077 RepID=A0A151Z341_TIELA|nr:hypothetical protein DLAC_11063 [Tieghemostelium lacteum]|eukprot:KYQ88365.1 hypothetical protein DLAC_11063 [Tieghemostelium lacteum]